MRDTPDSVAARVADALLPWSDEPWRYDFFAVLRRLEAAAATTPRWGLALLPSAEPIRVGQEPSMAFAPASFSRFEPASGHSPPRLRQQFFGYIGPNGPLPTHLSEFIQGRALNHGDRTWLAFLDSFTHRFALHLYRAWAQARPAVALDRPGEDRFRNHVGSLVGVGTATRQGRDALHDDARLHFAGRLIRQVRNTEGVQAVLCAYFGVPVTLEPWVGRWMELPTGEVTRLGLGGVSRALGLGAVTGRRIWDRQHQVRLHVGPLTLAQYRVFLPDGSAGPAWQAWLRQLLGDELDWDAELILKKDEVPVTRLGQRHGASSRLGWTSWLGRQMRTRDAADVRVRNRAAV